MTLRELLKAKDISGAQLGRRLDVNRSTVTHWCKTKYIPKRKVPLVANALGVDEQTIIDCCK